MGNEIEPTGKQFVAPQSHSEPVTSPLQKADQIPLNERELHTKQAVESSERFIQTPFLPTANDYNTSLLDLTKETQTPSTKSKGKTIAERMQKAADKLMNVAKSIKKFIKTLSFFPQSKTKPSPYVSEQLSQPIATEKKQEPSTVQIPKQVAGLKESAKNDDAVAFFALQKLAAEGHPEAIDAFKTLINEDVKSAMTYLTAAALKAQSPQIASQIVDILKNLAENTDVKKHVQIQATINLSKLAKQEIPGAFEGLAKVASHNFEACSYFVQLATKGNTKSLEALNTLIKSGANTHIKDLARDKLMELAKNSKEARELMMQALIALTGEKMTALIQEIDIDNVSDETLENLVNERLWDIKLSVMNLFVIEKFGVGQRLTQEADNLLREFSVAHLSEEGIADFRARFNNLSK